MVQRGANSYRLKVYAGVDPVSGRRRYEYRTVRGTKAEAKAALAALEAEVRHEMVAPPEDRRTLAELWDRYAERVLWNPAKGMSEETRGEYERNWRIHLGPALGSRYLSLLTVEDVEEWHLQLLATPCRGRAASSGRTLSASTAQKCHKLLCALLTTAVRWEWITAPHVAARCGGLRVSDPVTVRAPDPDVVRRLLEAAEAKDVSFGAFFRLAAVTGARRGELGALQWDDLDLEVGVVRISKALQQRHVDRDGRRLSGEVVADPKTRASVRTLAIDPRTVAVVAAHRDEVERRRREAGLDWNPSAMVFSADVEGLVPESKQVWTRRWERLQPTVGVTGIRLHDLRHFVGVTLAETEPLRTVMDTLGHTRLSTTGIYQVRPVSWRAALRMASQLDGPN